MFSLLSYVTKKQHVLTLEKPKNVLHYSDLLLPNYLGI